MRCCRARVDPEAQWLAHYRDYGSLPYNEAVGDRCNGRSQDPALRGTSGATAEGRRRVFIDGFPHHGEEFIPSHPFTCIPTASGVALSAAAAEPQIEPAP